MWWPESKWWRFLIVLRQARTWNTGLLAGALGPNCIMNSDLGQIAGREALFWARNRPVFSKHVSIAPFLHTQDSHPPVGKQTSHWGIRTKKAMTSESWVLLVWAGCPQEEPSTKCGIKVSLRRRKNTSSQAYCSESSTLRHSQWI